MRAYDLYLQALPRFRAGRPEENAAAHALLAKAIALEPDNGTLLAEAARVIERGLVMGWPPLTVDDRVACVELARRGLAHARGDASVLATCGLALIHAESAFDVGLATLRRALEANPNQFRVLMSAGIGHLHCGSLEEALTCFARALRLSPGSPSAHVALTGTAHAHFLLHRYQESVESAQRSLALSGDYPPTYWMLIGACAMLGKTDEARQWRERFQALAPEATVARIRAAQPESERSEALLHALRVAGLPET